MNEQEFYQLVGKLHVEKSQLEKYVHILSEQLKQKDSELINLRNELSVLQHRQISNDSQ